MSARIESLRKMLETRPDDPRLHFGLSLEYLNAGHLQEGVAALQGYLERTDDEGNAWGRLGAALRELGREEEAQEAYRRGIQAAGRHGHPTMVEEFEGVLGNW